MEESQRLFPAEELPPLSPPPPPPPPPKGNARRPHTDPRRFPFAIVCVHCDAKFATLQEARSHFTGACPSGLLVDVLCGHCGMRTSSWPSMCHHLNQPGMQRQPAYKAEYRMMPSARPEFPAALQPQRSVASPTATAVVGQVRMGQRGRRWRSPPPLTLSPSREIARTSRRAELSSVLRHWARKNPGITGLHGVRHGPVEIPLESTRSRGYRLGNAAAGSARDLAPASPDPEEPYSPPALDDPWLREEGILNCGQIVNRVSPLATPPCPLVPTESGVGAVGLPPAYAEACPLALPGSPAGEVGPPAVPFEGGIVGQTAAFEEVPSSAPVEGHGGPWVMSVSDMIEEAATAARILQEPELSDILNVPELSLFSPPMPVPPMSVPPTPAPPTPASSVPAPPVKPEPEEVVVIPDSPPPVRPPTTEAPVDYRRAYEDLQRRMRGHLDQMHFWALTVGELGQELTRAPTAQERARRQRLIAAGYWPPWMDEVVGAPFSVLGEQFRIYYGALLHEGGPRF